MENLPEIESQDLIDPDYDIGINKCLIERTGSERKSKPVLGKLAKARLIAARVNQLKLGATPAIKYQNLKSGDLIEIAKQELEERVLPIRIRRTFDDGTCETWSLKDFKYIHK